MKARSVIMAFLLALGLQAGAQETREYTFKQHAYIQVQGGVQHTLGEAKFGDLISPNVQLGVGWQITSWFGIRLAANAWQSKAGWSGYVEGNITPSETVTFKYNYVAPGLDFMFNLSNAVCGFNPKRVFNLSAFVGGAANIAWGNDEAATLAAQGYDLRHLWTGTKVRPVARGGIDLDFRLCDAVSIGIEANANMVNDKYNSKKAGNVDWYFNALVGLRINLGKTYRKKAVAVPEPEPEPVIVVEPATEPGPAAETEAEAVVVEPIRRDIFFVINESVIRDEEAHKIEEIAEYMEKYPGSKIEVTGYADAGTGTREINARLAAERARSVVDELTGRHGIDAGRITSDSKGDTVQPFEENDLNRVSICIAR